MSNWLFNPCTFYNGSQRNPQLKMSMKMFVDKKHQHGHTRENNWLHRTRVESRESRKINDSSEHMLKVEKVGKVHSNCKSY